MKKMRRFLSLLICMVMLVGVLPMSASAAEFSNVTIAVDTTGNTVDSVVNSISATGSWFMYTNSLNKSNVVPSVNDGEVTVTFELRPNYQAGDYFNRDIGKNSVSVTGIQDFNPDTDLTVTKVDWDSGRFSRYLKITLKFPAPHTHSYGGWVTTDPDEHWKECECGDKTAVGDHSFRDTYVTTDDTNHWKACVCGAKTAEGAHQYGDWIEDGNKHYKECAVCHKKVYADHAYGDEWIEDGNQHYKVCEDCDKRISEGHTPSTNWTAGDENHWHACEKCGAKSGEEEHSFGDYVTTDNTNHWKECKCGARSAEGAHQYGDWIEDGNQHYKECRDCHKKVYADHSYGDWIKNSNGHYKECVCKKRISEGGHDFKGDNTCDTCLYTKQIHTVKFNIENYKNDPSDAQVENGALVSEPKPLRAGHRLDGWYTEDGTKYDFSTPVTDDLNLTARWVQLHTITFNGWGHGGSTIPAPLTVDHDAYAEKPADPTDADYDFVDWVRVQDNQYGPDTLVPFNFTTTKITRDITLFARWTEKSYTIEYELDGGSLGTGESNPESYKKSDNTFKLKNPTRTGYTFKGWTGTGLDEATTDVYIRNGSSGDKSFTATWEAIDYKITYMDGGTELNHTPDTFTVATETFSLTAYEKNGYTFNGWYENNEFSGSAVTSITKGTHEDKVFYGKWTVIPAVKSITIDPKEASMYPGQSKTFTVDIQVVGGFSNEVVWSVEPKTELMLLSDEAPTATITDGVLTLTANASGKYTVKVMSAKDPSMFDTATVTVTPYKVEFNMNGHGNPIDPQEIAAGGKVTKPADPTDPNYAFGGWYLDEKFETSYDFDDPVNKDLRLHAKWVEYVDVTFNANGGTGTMDGIRLTQGAGYQLPENGFTAPSGKVFKCWRVGRTDYKPGEMITVEEDTEVKAIWTTKTVASDLDYVPAAGDNFPTFLWAGLLLFSVIALAEVVSIRRKRS